MGDRMIKTCIALLVVITLSMFAQESKSTKEEQKDHEPVTLMKGNDVPDGAMKQYFLVLLRRGPMRDQDSTTLEELQKQHLANISRLAQEGIIDIAGPFGHDGDLRGIFIMNVDSYETAKAACDTDPMIKCGRLVAEIYPWWSMKGAQLR